jgi:hypothetical protein
MPILPILVLLVLVVVLVLQGQLVQEEHRARLVAQGISVQRDQLVVQEMPDLLDHKVLLAQLAVPEQMEISDQLDHKELLAIWVQPVHKEMQEQMEILVQQDHKARVLLVQQVRPVM